MGVGWGGREAERMSLLRDALERMEDVLFRHDCLSRGSNSHGEADLGSGGVGSVAGSEIAGARWSGRRSNDDGYFFNSERRRSTKYVERASRCFES